jgi:hypothetical protein
MSPLMSDYIYAPPPTLTYSECMDRLFEMWVAAGDGSTFEEFIAQ